MSTPPEPATSRAERLHIQFTVLSAIGADRDEWHRLVLRALRAIVEVQGELFAIHQRIAASAPELWADLWRRMDASRDELQQLEAFRLLCEERHRKANAK